MKPVKNQEDVCIFSTLRRPRRGRPKGSKRIPLSIVERKARNALYERERRQEMSAAMKELAEAVSCSTNNSQDEVLASAISLIHRANNYTGYSIKDFHRINEKLEAQIIALQERLGLDHESFDNSSDDEFMHPAPQTSMSTNISKKRVNQEAISTAEESLPLSNVSDIEQTIIPEINFLSENEMKMIFDCLDSSLLAS